MKVAYGINILFHQHAHTSGTVLFWLVKPALAAGWFMHNSPV